MAQHRQASALAFVALFTFAQVLAATASDQDVKLLLVKRKYPQAFAMMVQDAGQGDANAALRLANAYRLGVGAPQDLKAATKWYGVAADRGSADARKILAKLGQTPPATPLKSAGINGAAVQEVVDYSALPARPESQPSWFTLAVARHNLPAVQALAAPASGDAEQAALVAALKAAKPDVLKALPQDALAHAPLTVLAATQSGNRELLDVMIAAKPDLNAANAKGQRAVDAAAGNCDAEALTKLVQVGVQLNANGTMTPPLVQVARNCDDWSKFSNAFGASDVNAMDENGRTAAWYAALRNNLSLLNWLDEHHADLSLADKLGYRPLHAAAAASHADALKFLLSKSKELNPPSANGTTPVMLAAYAGCKDCLAPLLQDLAEINKKNADGDTSLNFAVRGLQAFVAQTLVANGGNFNARNLAGDTPEKLGQRLSVVLKPGN
jgi:ankyrin repeat protein